MTRDAGLPGNVRPGGPEPTPEWLSMSGVFLFALLLRLMCFKGLIASDDLAYSGYAQLLAEGRYVLEYHHFAIRYGVLLPVGLLYWLVGVSEWSTIAVPLIASSLSAVLLALIGTKLFGVRAGLIAGLLFATFPEHLHDATLLLPEPIAEFYVFLALLVYVHTEDSARLAMGALAGALLGAAYLSKEPALFIAPALLLDAVWRRRWRHAFGVAVGLGGVIAVEHAYYLSVAGDLLFRVHAMAVHNRSVTGGKNVVQINLAYRLFEEYPAKMLIPNRDFGAHSLAALLFSGVAVWRFGNDRRVWLLLLWAALPWIYLNFGTTSFSRYIPIPVVARYIDFAYPPLFLLTGWVLADFLSLDGPARPLVIALVAAILLAGAAYGFDKGGPESDYARSVAVLRVIEHKVASEKLGAVCFDVDPGTRARWRSELVILSRGKLRECDETRAHVVVGADQLGFPYVSAIQR